MYIKIKESLKIFKILEMLITRLVVIGGSIN